MTPPKTLTLNMLTSSASVMMVIIFVVSMFVVVVVESAVTLTRDEYLVRGLDKLEPAFKLFDGSMYAGLIPTTSLSELENVDDSPGKLMFWLFDPIKPSHDDTIVIWMNGGPGLSN